MPKRTFCSEYRAEFWDSERDVQLSQLAGHYHDVTEEFDQSVCQYRNERGFAVPQAGWERQQCAAYARDQMADHWWLARQLGATWLDWHEHLRIAARELERRGWRVFKRDASS